MKQWTVAVLGAILTLPAVNVAADAGEGGMRVLGRVISSASPVPEAIVIALSMTDSISFRSGTSDDGTYRLPDLPRGIYRILAVKRGFAPAMVTIVPNRAEHAINFNLRTEESLDETEREEIWRIRRSIPSDILRELGMDEWVRRDTQQPPSVSGMLYSLSGIASETGSSWTQTAVGLNGNVDGWSVGLNGRLSSSADEITDDRPMPDGFETSTVAMRIESSGDSVYELSSNRSRWIEPAALGSEASLDAHRVGWKGDQSGFEIRYLNHRNILSDDPHAQIALEGQTMIVDRKAFDFGVGVKLEQFEDANSARYEVAEISTTAQQDIGDSFTVAYGVRGRYSEVGTQWVPETSARIDLGKTSSIVVSGHYKVYQDDQQILTLPAVLYFDDRAATYPRYRYAFGFILGSDAQFVSAMASVAEIDSKTRMLFDQRFDGRADGLWLEDGDVTRDLTLRLRRMLAGRLALEVASTAGEARGIHSEPSRYLTGSFQSLYRPSGTSLDLAYRYIEQSADSEAELLENERLAFRMGQSLWLPLDLKLLFGVDFIRDELGGLNPAEDHEDLVQTRLVGGLSLAF